MPLTVKVGEEYDNLTVILKEPIPPQATVNLKIAKTASGDIMITDHPIFNIFLTNGGETVVTIPKPNMGEKAYPAQRELLDSLVMSGLVKHDSIQGGMIYGALEGHLKPSEETSLIQSLLYEIEQFIKSRLMDYERVEDYEDDIDARFLEPSDEESTEHGEIKPEEDMRKNVSQPFVTYSGNGFIF
jgi:hypothetical protein